MTTRRDDALLLVGHGSSHFADAGRSLHIHADALRASFAEVAVGLLKGVPPAAESLAALHQPVVHVVPCFMENGWFVRRAVPAALGLHGRCTVLRDGAQRVRYCAPVGVHAGMAALIEARALCRVRDPGETMLLLVGHGSARAPGRPMALHRHAAALAGRGRFRDVRTAFLEEPPFVADALRTLIPYPAAVLGCFLGEGGHVRQDLPALLDAHRGDALTDLGTIGDEPGLAGIILEQIAGWSETLPW